MPYDYFKSCGDHLRKLFTYNILTHESVEKFNIVQYDAGYYYVYHSSFFKQRVPFSSGLVFLNEFETDHQGVSIVTFYFEFDLKIKSLMRFTLLEMNRLRNTT